MNKLEVDSYPNIEGSPLFIVLSGLFLGTSTTGVFKDACSALTPIDRQTLSDVLNVAKKVGLHSSEKAFDTAADMGLIDPKKSLYNSEPPLAA